MHCLLFLRDMYQKKINIRRSCWWRKLVNELIGIYKGVKPAEQKSFLNNAGLFLLQEEKIFKTLKAKYFH